MRKSLNLHPESPRFAGMQIEVDLVRSPAHSLKLSYVVTGRISDLVMPALAPTLRRNELWRHTCFEAFVGDSTSAEYYEFNFAPSTEWAAYRFSSYRSGLQVAKDFSAPTISMKSSPESHTLQVLLELDRLSDLPVKSSWRVGLSAIVEHASGHKSYWALTHPPGKPDFHHPVCFAHELYPVVEP